jgi:hypothetical protein
LTGLPPAHGTALGLWSGEELGPSLIKFVGSESEIAEQEQAKNANLHYNTGKKLMLFGLNEVL